MKLCSARSGKPVPCCRRCWGAAIQRCDDSCIGGVGTLVCVFAKDVPLVGRVKRLDGQVEGF